MTDELKQWEYDRGYEQGRADEQLQSIEDAKMQATEYLDALNKAKEEAYQQGAREFAEWLPQHFDLRFSNNPDVWIDEFFNHTRDEVLAEWQKGTE